MKKSMSSDRPAAGCIAVTESSVLHIITYDQITYLKAEDDYTIIHLEDKQTCLVCKKLKTFEENLCKSHFYRCHRSYLINLFLVKEIRTKKCEVWLTTGDSIPVARRRISGLRSNFK